ncbi:MAG TPA: transglutaminase-like domain-containing protein [Phycisphaerae bacterium]|nr:transglutaminase-like domain-containing protein [Phycisphaerae bacterium]
MRIPVGLTKRWLVCGLVGVLVGVLLLPQASPAGTIDSADPPRGLFSDEWMVILFAGQKAGYAHQTMSRQDDVVTTRMIMTFRLGRAGQDIELSTMESSEETVAGKPLSFESAMKVAVMDVVYRGRFTGSKVHVETTQGGMTLEQTYTLPEGVVLSWGAYAEQLRRGLEEGTTYELLTYAPSLVQSQPVTTRVAVGKCETIDLLGRSVAGTRVNSTVISPMGALDQVSWMDADGRLIKMEMDMMGLGSIELILSDKETATRQAPAPEFFVNTMVPAGRKIDRAAARRLEFRLRVTGEEEPIPDLPTTGMQKPRRGKDNSIQLVVTRQDHKALQSARLSEPSADLAPYLEPNIWINSDDPEVIAMAKTAAGDAKTPYQIADRLRCYVTEVIEEKNLNIGFASASEVCRNKEGDCSEHGVLLAALGRVHRIPSRVVIGLVYVPWFAGTADTFGFHMWTQFHLGGQWVDFDAAQRESDCNPTHIAVATSSLKDSSLADMAFGLIKIIGRLEIEVLSADPPTAITSP